MIEVARVTGGEKMAVVSDSGVEVDIRVQANGLPDVADLTVQKSFMGSANSTARGIFVAEGDAKKENTDTITRKQAEGRVEWEVKVDMAQARRNQALE